MVLLTQNSFDFIWAQNEVGGMPELFLLAQYVVLFWLVIINEVIWLLFWFLQHCGSKTLTGGMCTF